MELIFCSGGNRRFVEIAVDAGFLYGARLPSTVHPQYALHFADQDWRKPDQQKYISELKKHKPYMASVLDLEYEDQLGEVLAWAEDAAQFVDIIMIIPKFFGAIGMLPRSIGGKSIRLGYSVPTQHGGTMVPAWEFTGWPVHLLGGSPQRQMELVNYFNVASVDGNYAQKMAIQYGQFWTNGTATYAKNRYWPKLSESGCDISDDMPYEAFYRSCKNIMKAWLSIVGNSVFN